MKSNSLMTILVLLLIYGASAPLSARAGAKVVGNGGDVIYCGGAHPTAELLDFYEARTSRGMTIPQLPGATYQEKLAQLFSGISSRFPIYAREWSAEAQAFEQNANFLPGVNLRDVPDSNHLAVPVGCEIRQIVIQSPPRFPGDKLFTVSQDLWNLLDDNNRAGLVLHELVYKTALNGGAENSIGARYVNSSLFTGQLLTFSDQQLAEVFLQANIQGLEVLFPGGSVRVPPYRIYGRCKPFETDCDETVELIKYRYAVGKLSGVESYDRVDESVAYFFAGEVLRAESWTSSIALTSRGLEIYKLDGRLPNGNAFSVTGLKLGDGLTCFVEYTERGGTTEIEFHSGGTGKPTCLPGNPLASGFVKNLNWAQVRKMQAQQLRFKVKGEITKLADFFGNPAWQNDEPVAVEYDSNEYSVIKAKGRVRYVGRTFRAEIEDGRLLVDAEGHLLSAEIWKSAGRTEIPTPFGPAVNPTSFSLTKDEEFSSVWFSNEQPLRFSFGTIAARNISCTGHDGYCQIYSGSATITMQGKLLPTYEGHDDILVHPDGWLRRVNLVKPVTLKNKNGKPVKLPAGYVYFTKDGLVDE